MKARLKKLRDQVIVLTGASSGIGLVTARLAAKQGARLVLAARSTDELERLAAEIGKTRAVAVTADVGDEEDVQRIAQTALERFGGFDTWVNDAGISVFGRLEEVATEDHRRVFETNFWGVVYGSLAAARYLRQRGGAIINLGSVASDRAIPLQGMYSASKHAVKGFTDALRMELEKEGAPVAVTLIKPTSIGTPFPRHAGNYLPNEPTLPPPVYAPDLVAEAILYCAQHPQRDYLVGDAARMMSAMGLVAPRLTDKRMEASMFEQQQKNRAAHGGRHGSLYHPSHDLAERGEYSRRIHEHSPTTSAKQYPILTGATVVGAGLAIGALWNLYNLRQTGTTGSGRQTGKSANQQSAAL